MRSRTMLLFVLFLLTLLTVAAASPSVAQATEMEVSCYGDCGTGYNPLYGNPTCTDSTAFFTGESYTAAAIPTYAPGSILQITNVGVDPYTGFLDDDYGATVTVLVDDCHYGYSRFDLSSAAFYAIQEHEAGVAWVDVQVIRDGWDGTGWQHTGLTY